MAEQLFFPPYPVSSRPSWLDNFVTVLEPVYANYGISDKEFNDLKADNTAFNYTVDRMNVYEEARSYFLLARNAMWSGDEENPNLPQVPFPSQAALVEVVPPTVPPDIYNRVKSLVIRLRRHPLMTEAFAQEMGILSPDKPELRSEEFKPVLNAKVQKGKVELNCPLKQLKGYEVWCDDQGGPNYVHIKTSVSRYWTDERPLLDGVDSQLRSYRVRMLSADNQAFGNFSNEVVLRLERNFMR